MVIRGSILAAGASVALVIACGGSVQVAGGSGGGNGGGTGVSTTNGSASSSSGQGGSLPQECEVQAQGDGPYAVNFHLVNNSTETLFVASRDCNQPYSVTSCADDYAEPIAMFGQCTVDCVLEPDACIDCDCFEGPIAVEPGSAYEGTWFGYTYTFDHNTVGCSCHHQQIARAARYRVTVPLYASEQDAWDEVELAVRVVDFELSAEQLDLVVDLEP